jgi:hypothetical protein
VIGQSESPSPRRTMSRYEHARLNAESQRGRASPDVFKVGEPAGCVDEIDGSLADYLVRDATTINCSRVLNWRL